MKLKTSIVSSAFIASFALIPTPAKAWDVCRPYDNINLCANIGQTYDVIQLNGTLPNGEAARERFHVQCINDTQGSWRYTSVGTLSQQLANTFVEGYCSGRGGVHPNVSYPDPISSTGPETRDMTGNNLAPSAPPKDGFLF